MNHAGNKSQNVGSDWIKRNETNEMASNEPNTQSTSGKISISTAQ